MQSRWRWTTEWSLPVFDRLFGPDEDAADTQDVTSQADVTPPPDPDQDIASIRQAIAKTGSLSVERRRFLAGYAYILVRVARADLELNDREMTRIEEAVATAGELSESQGALLVALAGRMSSLYGATEDYAVTREFARRSSPQERQRLLRACVAVGSADGPLNNAEAHELYEIGQELGFSVEEIDAIRDQVDPRPTEPPPSSDP